MNEYIEKAELIKKLCFETAEWSYSPTIKTIKDFPAADVQPVKKGKWGSSQRTIETGTVYCSNCAIEYYISALQTVGDCNGIVHYCPNCGAKMDLKDGERV